ncbi:MAG: hypothetical protein COA69_03020 [Robiginitomaculum sp.]|nr:MAG: hypothetical protein COA69_03020 [Robiginitomaculum sp.]
MKNITSLRAVLVICIYGCIYGLSACAQTFSPSTSPDNRVAQTKLHKGSIQHADIIQSLIAKDKAFNTRNVTAGFNTATLEFLDLQDGFLLESGLDVLRGRAAISAQRDLNDIPSPLRWSPREAYVASSGDFGFTWGDFQLDVEDGKRKTGKYITIWRKDTKGQWKALTDMGLYDPDPVFAPENEVSEASDRGM